MVKIKSANFKAISDLVEIHGPVVRKEWTGEGVVKKWIEDEQVRMTSIAPKFKK